MTRPDPTPLFLAPPPALAGTPEHRAPNTLATPAPILRRELLAQLAAQLPDGTPAYTIARRR